MDYILSIDDATVASYGLSKGYSSQVTDNKGGFIPNPETQQQYVIRMLTESVRESINQYQANASFQAALIAPLPTPIKVAVNDSDANPLPISLK